MIEPLPTELRVVGWLSIGPFALYEGSL